MEGKEEKHKEKQSYEKPKVLASYQKEELEEAIQPEGNDGNSSGCYGGCGCGCTGCGGG